MVKVYTEIYHLKDLNKTFDGKLFKNQNVYNLIMSFMFRKTKIKSFIRLMIRQNNADKIKRFEQKLKIYSKKNKKFILIKNQEWNLTMKKSKSNENYNLKNEKKVMQTQPNKQVNDESGENLGINESSKAQSSSFLQVDDKKMLDSFKSRIQSSCYEGSLRLVSELSSASLGISPISKLKIIIGISKCIMKQIQQFYLIQLGVGKDKIPQIEPDNLTSIIMYLIVVNNDPALYEQLKMVEYFTTTNTLNCISGYYLNMFIAAIDMVTDLKF